MIAIGSDHAAFEPKQAIKACLIERRYESQDFGRCGPARVEYCDFDFPPFRETAAVIPLRRSPRGRPGIAPKRNFPAWLYPSNRKPRRSFPVKRSRLVCILASTMLAIAGCGGSKSGSNPPPPSPTVANTTPANGATGVAVNSTVTATFSTAMNAASLTASTFTLASSAGAVTGSVTYSTTGNTAAFAPSASLAYNTQYTASVKTGATDTAGTALASPFIWQFTTAAAPAAPTVTSTTPTIGATGVANNTPVVAIFSEAMNPTTFSSATFTLMEQGGGIVAGTVSYSATNSAAQFTPSTALSNGTTYSATITTGVTSTSGQALAANYSWSFTTAGDPAVQSTTPVDGATAVPITDQVTAIFSQTMNTSTLNTSTFTLTSASGSVAGTVTYSSASNTATFTPSASLAYGTVYAATITTGAMNSGGIPLASNYSWSFTTGAVPSGTATVDFGTADQIMHGFGGSNAFLGALTTQQATALFSQTSGLGLSVLRVRIDPSGSPSNNPAYYTSNWGAELTNANEAISANSNTIVFASPYTPPVSMKTSSSSQPYYTASPACYPGPDYCGGYLNPSSYAAYASYLEDFVQYFANNGVTLYAVSMANEPDYSDETSENYESCSWTPQQLDTWVASLTARGPNPLIAKLIMPESYAWNFSMSDPTLEDSSAVGNVSIIGEHLYGGGPTFYTNAIDLGKDVWMTEHYLSPSGGGQPTITDALTAAVEIQNTVSTGYANAYVWYWVWEDPNESINYGLINSNTTSPAPTYYGYAVGQFAKFIQPGYYRYDATANPYANVYISAYSGSEAGTTHYIIVAINAGSVPVSQLLMIYSATVTSLTPWQTTGSGGLVQQSAVTVSGGTFTYTLPAQSITTFVQ